MVDDLRWASAVSVAARIRSGELGQAQVRAAALDRIDRLDPGLGAVVIDLRERDHPPAKGPFTGVPILLKDAGGPGGLGTQPSDPDVAVSGPLGA